MKIRTFVLSKSSASSRVLNGDSLHFNIRNNAYTYDIEDTYRDADGLKIPISIYHANNIFPYPVTATDKKIDEVCAITELAKMERRKILTGMSKGKMIAIICGVVFAVLYMGAI